MITKLSPKVYEMYSGHSLETGMKIYAHLDTTNIKNELWEKVYNIEVLTKVEKQEIKELQEQVKELHGQLAVSNLVSDFTIQFHTGKIDKKEFVSKMKEVNKLALKTGYFS